MPGASPKLAASSRQQSIEHQELCEKFPWLCEAPFNCNTPPVTPEERAHWDNVHWATDDGHPNFRSFCHFISDAEEMGGDMGDLGVRAYTAIGKTCIQDGDIATFAKTYYAMSDDYERDAQYCFTQGLCTITNVTTLDEAEATCDAKYGHETWTSFKQDNDLEMSLGPRDRGTYLGHWGCAAGHFLCDVGLCRNTFCNMKEWVEKYGHYLQDYGYTS